MDGLLTENPTKMDDSRVPILFQDTSINHAQKLKHQNTVIFHNHFKVWEGI